MDKNPTDFGKLVFYPSEQVKTASIVLLTAEQLLLGSVLECLQEIKAELQEIRESIKDVSSK
jgi:tRNA(Ser,Leu) C12 N-acetylase TAN1